MKRRIDAAQMRGELASWLVDAGLMRLLFSGSPSKTRLSVRLAVVRGEAAVQLEHQEPSGKVRHANLTPDEAAGTLAQLLTDEYAQANARFWNREAQIVRKKDAFFLTEHVREETVQDDQAAPEQPEGHDRAKNHLLAAGETPPFLIELGILSPDGRILRDMGAKYKQVNRFLEFVRDVLPALPNGPLHIVDFGCGKSYLTFALHHYLTVTLGRKVTFTGIDLKSEVIQRCAALALRLKADDMRFICGDAHEIMPERADLVVSLHACDTATDAALACAIRSKARAILSVPCCHHELSEQIACPPLDILLKHGILKQRLAELATDALRAEVLELCGYRAQVMEFIEPDATSRNLMIRAIRRDGARADDAARRGKIQALMQLLSVDPALWRAVSGDAGEDGHA